MKEEKKSFPNQQLREERERRGWSRLFLAEQINLADPKTIGRWERGVSSPNAYFRRKLCSLFQLEAENLGLAPENAHPFSDPLTPTQEAPLFSQNDIVVCWHVPYQRNHFFTGRAEILEILHAYLGTDQSVDSPRSYALYGLGGVGKTQIALEYAYRYRQDYRAVFWIDAETRESIVASMTHIAERLQLQECKEENQQRIVAAVHQWFIAQSRWLLIWDNVEEMSLLERFLPPSPQGAILITTRNQTLGTLAQSLELEPMAREEGILFILRRTKLCGEDVASEQTHLLAQRSPREYAAAEELVRVMGGLPLALDQAGAYIEETRCSIAQYLQLFEQHSTRFLGRRGMPASNHPHSVIATFFLAYTQIELRNPIATEILRLCAFLSPDAIPEELLSASIPSPELAPWPVAADSFQMNLAFAVLHAFSLVQRQVETRTVSTHRLVQAVLQGRMSEQERAEVHQLVLHRLHALFPETSFEVWDQCERLLPHVLTCVATFPDRPDGLVLPDLLRKTADYLRERERHASGECLYRRALSILEQSVEPDRPLLAQILHGLALLLSRQGQHEQASSLCERALCMREQVFGQDHALVAQSLNVLGNFYTEQEHYEQAETLYQRALSIREHIFGSEHPLVASPLNNLAELARRQGKYQQAERLYEQALRIWTEALGPDIVLRWYALQGLADLFQEQRKDEQAEVYYRQALGLLEQAEGPCGLYVTYPLGGLALLACKQGRYTEAEAFYQRALAIQEQYLDRHHPEIAHILNGLAYLAVHQGRYEQAEIWYQQALSIREQQLPAGHSDIARSLAGLARLYLRQGNILQAEPLLQRAFCLFEQRLGREHPETAQTRNDLESVSRELLPKKEGRLSEPNPTSARTTGGPG